MNLSCGRFLVFWLFCTVASSISAAPSSKEPNFTIPEFKGKWTLYTSPNFEIYSQVSEKDSREALHQLELIRAFFLTTYHCTESAKTPVTLYFFRNEKSLQFFLNRDKGSGIASAATLNTPSRSQILLSHSDESSWMANIVLHEYIHHLVASTHMRIPLWMNEGFAETFSTIRIVKGKLEVGRPPVFRLTGLMWIPRLPLSLVVASAGYQSSSYVNESFYGKSWALVHYLYFGKNPFPPESKGKLLDWYQENPSRSLFEIEATFKTLFGVNLQELDDQVNRYVDKNSSFALGVYDPPKIDDPATYKKRPVSPSEIVARLWGVAASFGRSAKALPQLNLLSQTDKADARVFEDLGSCALLNGSKIDAQSHWLKAVELGSTNPAIERRLMALEIEPWLNVFTPSNEMAPPFVETMRKRLLKSIAADPEQSAAYETLAWVEAFAAKADNQNILLIQKAYTRLFHRDQVTLAFALISWRGKKTDQALALLNQLQGLDPDLRIQQNAEALRAAIENRKPVYKAMKPSIREQTSQAPLDHSDKN